MLFLYLFVPSRFEIDYNGKILFFMVHFILITMEFWPPCILVNSQILLEKLVKTIKMAPCCEQVKHHMREVRPPNPIFAGPNHFYCIRCLVYNKLQPFKSIWRGLDYFSGTSCPYCCLMMLWCFSDDVLMMFWCLAILISHCWMSMIHFVITNLSIALVLSILVWCLCRATP